MATNKTTVNLDTAARLDIVCRKGDTFVLALDFGKEMANTSPTSATGGDAASYELQVRETDTATGTTLTMSGNEVVVSDGKKTDSKITITKAAASMNVDAGVYVYDFQQTLASGTVKTYLYGTFTINEDVTVVS